MPSDDKTPTVTISIVTWNSGQVVEACLQSLRHQTYRRCEIVVVDNASTDRTIAIAQQFPEIKLVRNTANLGYSSAHNQVILSSRSPYVLCSNPDVVYDKRYLERLIEDAEKHPHCASFGGKLLRLHQEHKDSTPLVIDSAGLQFHRVTGNVTNRGEGEEDMGQYDGEAMIFGHSGSAVLYRREALEKIRYRNEFFDEDFFAYKEDADLAWRLQRAKLCARYVPTAVAWHTRRFRTSDALSQRDERLVRLSLRNHLLMLIKNISYRDLPFIPSIAARELFRLVVYLILRPRVLIGVWQAMGMSGGMLKKR